MKKQIMFAATFAVLVAEAAVSITGVTARQRWPWNSLVDVDFTISGAAVGEAFAIDVNAECAGGEKKLAACTYATEPIAGPGSNRITWDMGADYPNFRAEDLRISVTATPFSGDTPVYMVIDLSGGKNATTYPVRYTTTPPAHMQGAIDEPCQTTELWLRRIPAHNQTFVVGDYRYPAANNNAFFTKLTKDYYIGIFETTQQQWFQLTGKWPSYFSNETFRASRPLDRFYPELAFGSNGATWSDENQTLLQNCLMQKLRDRTGISTLNLPTEAQWQFAACAGTIATPDNALGAKYIYNGYTLAEVGRYQSTQDRNYEAGLCDTNNGTTCVGAYKPNNFGLYDTIGNVTEVCLDRKVNMDVLKNYYVENGYEFPVVDPQGLPVSTATSLNGSKAVVDRGAYHAQSSSYHTLWQRSGGYVNYCADGAEGRRGFRFCVTCE